MSSAAPSLKARLVGVAARALHAPGLLALARGVAGRPNAQILIYHRVNDEGDPYFGGIPVALFERQIAYLAANYHVMPLDDLVGAAREGALPPRAVAITLDDGYRDNYVHAFPIFQRHRIPASIFLTTAAIGSDRPIWHDDVFSAFRDTRADSLAPFGPRGITGLLSTVPDRLRVQQEVLGYLRSISDEERAAGVLRLRGALGVGPVPPAPGLMLSWDEVREMARGGVRFGSHTVTHPILSRVDGERAKRELVESKARIEDELKSAVTGFAYPNGTRADYTPETKELLRDAGYAYAVTTIAGTNDRTTDPYELRRATPWEEDIFAFGARMLYNKWRS